MIFIYHIQCIARAERINALLTMSFIISKTRKEFMPHYFSTVLIHNVFILSWFENDINYIQYLMNLIHKNVKKNHHHLDYIMDWLYYISLV